MKNKIDELQNAATLLKLDYKIISGNEANDIINKIFNIYISTFKINGHLLIGNDNSTKLKTDENECTFSFSWIFALKLSGFRNYIQSGLDNGHKTMIDECIDCTWKNFNNLAAKIENSVVLSYIEKLNFHNYPLPKLFKEA